MPEYKKKLAEELYQRCRELNKVGKREETEIVKVPMLKERITLERFGFE